MDRTKELQLLQTVIGVITLNINNEEKVFTVFYGGSMYPWVNDKMLVMPENKYNDMLRNFFKGDGQEYIIPSSQQIAQDRATVINNYRAGMYINPDGLNYNQQEPVQEEQSREPETYEEFAQAEQEHENENTTDKISEEIEYTQQEPEYEDFEEHEQIEQAEESDSSEETQPFPNEFSTSDDVELSRKSESRISSETIDEIRAKGLLDERTMLKDGLAFVNEIDDIGALFTKPVNEALDELILSASNEELDKMAKFLVEKYNLEDRLNEPVEEPNGSKQDEVVPNEERENSDSELQPENENDFVQDVQTSSDIEETSEPAEARDSEEQQGGDEIPVEEPKTEPQEEPVAEEPKSEDEFVAEPETPVEEENVSEKEAIREVIYKTDDSRIEQLFDEIRKLQAQIPCSTQEATKEELASINNKVNKLIEQSTKPNYQLDNLTGEIRELVSRNEKVDVTQIENLVDEQNRMMSKQNETIQELTKTVESQKAIIDSFQAKIDKTQKMEKNRVKKTWIIMILGVIIMVGITVCTQLFLPKAESAIQLDSDTDAEVHIVVHNEDGTDSFERIGSIIIKDGKLQISE